MYFGSLTDKLSVDTWHLMTQITSTLMNGCSTLNVIRSKLLQLKQGIKRWGTNPIRGHLRRKVGFCRWSVQELVHWVGWIVFYISSECGDFDEQYLYIVYIKRTLMVSYERMINYIPRSRNWNRKVPEFTHPVEFVYIKETIIESKGPKITTPSPIETWWMPPDVVILNTIDQDQFWSMGADVHETIQFESSGRSCASACSTARPS